MERIVVGVDGSESSQYALEWAAAQARLTGAKVAVVTAAPDGMLLAPVEALAWVPPADLEAEATYLQRSIVDRADVGGIDLERIVALGQPWKVLDEHAAMADLLVVGSHGLGALAGSLLGSLSHQAVSHATYPVVVVPRASRPPSRIVVGVDGSETSVRAAAWAGHLAEVNDATLELVMVQQWTAAPPLGAPYTMVPIPVPDPEELRRAGRVQLEHLVSGLSLDRLDVERTIVEGPVARRLLERAADANLLVVGSRGMGGFKGLLFGSVSHRVLHHAPCPVAVVH